MGIAQNYIHKKESKLFCLGETNMAFFGTLILVNTPTYVFYITMRAHSHEARNACF